MSRKLFLRPSQRKFLNLRAIGRKVKASRFTRRFSISSKMLVSTIGAKPVNELVIDSTTSSSPPLKRVPVDVLNKGHKDKRRVYGSNNNDGRAKIESILLEHQQELFSSHLSRNALQRLIKQKALEIASDLGLKFKGTRKWLISFVKRCELLGYINVDIFTDSQNENEEKSISVSTTSPSALISSDVLPDLSNLFSSANSSEPSSPLQLPQSVATAETPVAHIRSGCKPCLKQNLMQEKILSDSFKPSRNKLTKDDVTLRRKNYSLLRDSPLFSRVLYSPLYTGCKLKRSHTAALSSSTPETSNSVYDQLFELAQNKNVNHVDNGKKGDVSSSCGKDTVSPFSKDKCQNTVFMQDPSRDVSTAKKCNIDDDPLLHLFETSSTNITGNPDEFVVTPPTEGTCLNSSEAGDNSSISSSIIPDPLLTLFNVDHDSSFQVFPASPNQNGVLVIANKSNVGNNLESDFSHAPSHEIVKPPSLSHSSRFSNLSKARKSTTEPTVDSDPLLTLFSSCPASNLNAKPKSPAYNDSAESVTAVTKDLMTNHNTNKSLLQFKASEDPGPPSVVDPLLTLFISNRDSEMLDSPKPQDVEDENIIVDNNKQSVECKFKSDSRTTSEKSHSPLAIDTNSSNEAPVVLAMSDSTPFADLDELFAQPMDCSSPLTTNELTEVDLDWIDSLFSVQNPS